MKNYWDKPNEQIQKELFNFIQRNVQDVETSESYKQVIEIEALRELDGLIITDMDITLIKLGKIAYDLIHPQIKELKNGK